MKLYAGPLSRLVVTLATLTSHVAANADKIIFTGPEPVTYPLASPSLSDLNLDVIGPATNLSLRTSLSRIFHDDTDPVAQGKPPGSASWFILDGLTPGQRYELRVCWAAIVSLSSVARAQHQARNSVPCKIFLSIYLSEMKTRPRNLQSLPWMCMS